ncbi:MAG: PilZ domain-containing protein [Myxococcales bacterium]|nr:PilZ domain-containing protein [Myxococcales bacterium]
MTDDRRQAPRFVIWFPMQLTNDGDSILAISRDVSEVGVLVVAAAAPEVGARVSLTMQLPDDEAGARELEGTIVRVEPNEQDAEGLWRHRVAVALDARVEGLEALLERVSRSSQPPPAS